MDMNGPDFVMAITMGVGGLIILGLIGGSLIGFAGIADQRGESTYTGKVIDFENERGLLFKTTQAHLKTNAESSTAEVFCVHPDNRDQQVEILREAASEQYTVTVTYSRPYVVPLWTCEKDTSIIRNIQIHDPNEQ